LKIVLRIGGSVLGSPPDPVVVSGYATVIQSALEHGHRIAVVVGGGHIARQYIETAKNLGLPRRDQDMIAIHASRLNAKLVGLRLAAPSVPVSVKGMVSRLASGRIAVMGGLRPGITTDTVATLVAEAWHSDVMIKASNQDGIYTADPHTHKNAKLLRTISYTRLVEILGGRHSPGIHSIVDPVAVELIAEYKIKLVVVNGAKPENVLRVIDGEVAGTTVS
jgi:uridylate kinase